MLGTWLQAARPRTLPAAVVPVLVGTASADRVVAWRLAAALTVALAVQVGVNFANDYFDGVRGVDTPDRVGPRRAVASGLVAPARMRAAMIGAFAVACVAGLALAAAAGWWLVGVGAMCVAAALGYSGGPRPYASAALGEVFVFVFFGLVATVGSAYVQAARVPVVAVAAALPVGLLATAILVVNNLRDIATDRAAGKATLAVRMGPGATRRLYRRLVYGAFALLVPVAVAAGAIWPLLAVAAAPLGRRAVAAVAGSGADRRPVAALAATARLELVAGALLAAGLALA
ncbi:MAG: 1,4-dihydroxy-2-naphthoate polyprenyltransferase [Actinobacteria bacterium]|nr:1,4-dihydroxy-2-naphthoate polyprenyltransferase [Actinomycetota bacterium]